MLDALELQGGRAAAPLMTAIEALRALNRKARLAPSGILPLGFARPKWRERLTVGGEPIDPRAWETAILFSLCDAPCVRATCGLPTAIAIASPNVISSRPPLSQARRVLPYL